MMNGCRWSIAALFPALACLGAMLGVADDTPREIARLVDGVEAIAAPGSPGPVVVFGPDAFPVISGKAQGATLAPVAAAGTYGRGRIVALGHTGYAAAPDVAQTRRFLRNAIAWCGADAVANDTPLRVAAVDDEWRRSLSALGFTPLDLPRDGWIAQLAELDVLCLGQQPLTAEQIDAVRRFIRDGGGLVAAGLGWGWLQLNPGKSILEHPLNRLLGDCGIMWADGYAERTATDGFAARSGWPLTHAGRALDHILSAADVGHAAGDSRSSNSQSRGSPEMRDLAQASSTATLAAQTLPDDDTLLRPRLAALLTRPEASRVPSERNPIAAADALPRLLLALQIDALARLPAEKVRAHAAAAEFPGPVPADAPRVRSVVSIDCAVPDWHSTGLYAAPGEAISVGIPADAVGRGLEVRIGAHSDSLWHHDAWKRVPAITLQRRLSEQTTRVASAFGGLIYIDVPGKCAPGVVDVSISSALEAPFFVLGRTTLDEWRQVRTRAAPWAELASDKLIITLPSSAVRALERPDEVMQFWDEICDAHATLATIPLKRARPERFVTDAQISAGYMHSGYPIMTHLDVVNTLVDVDRLRHGDGLWGFVHELGHNHQSGDWTFAGTGEVTCNLFSLHAIDTVCRPPPANRGHDGVDKPGDVAAYLREGARFERWQGDPFLALQMYVQLERAFGWETYKRLFAEYRALRANERPRDDDAKRDQWMTRFSRACGHNLGPFFEAWGVPVSAAAREAVAGLPAWMPEGFPK
ncbi:MAG: hypothetical protein CHACPFDD_03904 [Phycisphaerae bacterium]|nr:hypothetical protein [Phycisphaerae bacterium]